MDLTVLDGRAYAKFITAGSYFLRKYRQTLNDLNVFPVPDGDTGTNMYLTARQAAIEAGKVRAAPLSRVAEAAAQGSLMGARGNSGVLISQMLRGFAHHVRHRSEIDTFTLATGLREAAQAARTALVRPVEGTILSVADAAADAAYKLALHENDFYRVCNGVLRAAADALDKTPEQLPLLKEAGVVDAGGAGFVYFLEGALRFLPENKVRATAFPRRAQARSVFTAMQSVGERKYCTEFILENATCSPLALREALQPRGESLIVAGEEPTIKVHIHTDDPQAVRQLAQKHGKLTRIKIDDMEQQHNVLVVDAPAPPYSIVAVVPGKGFEQIVRELGVEVPLVTNNPSVRDFLLAINAALSQTVYVFANDSNAVLAAKEAANLSNRTVHVVPTPDVVAGIAGLFAMRSGNGTAPSLEEIVAATKHPRSASVFFAGKDAFAGGSSVERGKPAGLREGVLHAAESLEDVAQEVLAEMGAQGGGLITTYYGGTQREKDAQRLAEKLRAAFPKAEVEYYYGGQRTIEYWISLDE